MLKLTRCESNPLITLNMHPSLGENINGPSLIRVPDWLPNPLGRYYLYFAHHHGTFIRLAYADNVEGPWKIHAPGTLQLEQTPYNEHIASPEVVVDHDARQIRLYYHGRNAEKHQYVQFTNLATSSDGLNFTSQQKPLAQGSYWRLFEWRDWVYSLAMPGAFFRSRDGLGNFEPGPTLFEHTMRHSAVRVRGDVLDVFYSRWGDTPERIVYSQIALQEDWLNWRETPALTVLEPELEYEGVGQPLIASEKGFTYDFKRELRDPGLYSEAGKTWLLYSFGAEQGLAIAALAE